MSNIIIFLKNTIESVKFLYMCFVLVMVITIITPIVVIKKLIESCSIKIPKID
jgi:hypothetical protein